MRAFDVVRRWHVAALLGALAVPVTACSPDEILAVRDPDIVDPSAVNSAAGAQALYNGSVGEFNFALIGDNGGQEGLILVGGLMTDEYIHSGTFPTRLEYEVRAIDDRNGTLLGVFRQAQRARTLSEATIPLLRQFRPTDPVLNRNVGEMFALQGMIVTFLGETYCSGVPLSQLFPVVVFDMPRTTAELFAEAVVRFDSAIAVFGPRPAVDTVRADSAIRVRVNLARVGRGRALLNLATSPAGFSAAAAAVVNVPLDFAYRSSHSTGSGRQQNGVHVFNVVSERWSVADVEGNVGLDFRSAADPRVVATRGREEVCTGTCPHPLGTDVGFDAQSPQWDLQKYPTNTSQLPIAQGVEAKLIIAEAMLQSGNTTAWLDTLNFLRANAGTIQTGVTLSPLTDPGTPTARQDLMFRERAFWLFATGHRLGDLRRLMRQYGRAEDAVFPTGRHFKNTTDYGNDVNIPVPFTERNNPHFNGCIDRNP